MTASSTLSRHVCQTQIPISNTLHRPSQYSPTYTATIRAIYLALIPILFYLSMSFLTKLFRPFTTMSSAPATPANVPAGAHTATVAAGCFWGVEHMYRRQFEKKGLYDARVGYIGGDTDSPSYRAVCSGRTGRK
jgi:hypothetical protein